MFRFVEPDPKGIYKAHFYPLRLMLLNPLGKGTVADMQHIAALALVA